MGSAILTLFSIQYAWAQNITKISEEEKNLCEDIMPDAKIDDDGTVTFDDGTTETCDNLIEQQAIGGIFPINGEPDKERTERAIEMRAALGLNATGFPALSYDELIQDFREAMGNDQGVAVCTFEAKHDVLPPC